MNTKKLLAILLAAIMMLALAACGDEPAPTPTPDPDPVDTPNEGGEDAQSVLTMYTFMDTVPDLVGTAWSFIGGCVNGVVMTEDQVNQVLSQMDDYYQFYFNDETTVTLYQGNDTAPEGTYSAVNDTTVKIEVEGSLLRANMVPFWLPCWIPPAPTPWCSRWLLRADPSH